MLARKITWMMGSAIALTVFMVVSTILWTANKNNVHAARDSLVMVSSGINGLSEKLAELNWDYAAWTAALTNSLVRNQDWLDENMGTGAGAGSFELMQISWPEDWSSVSWTAESEGVSTASTLLPIEFVRRIHTQLQTTELGNSQSLIFGIKLDDELHIFSAARIQPWQEQSPIPAEQLPILFMGVTLSSDRLAEIGQSFLIDDLTLVSEMPSEATAVPIMGLDGTPIAHLRWTPPRPGGDLIKTAIFPLTVALSLFFLLSGTVTVLARRSARELVNREGEASRIARIDALTGLPNRLAFNEVLAKHRNSDTDLALLFMDVNGFKNVNDTHGHRVGDGLIAELAKSVEACKQQDVFAARIGGDEFNVVFSGKTAGSDCEEFCIELIRALRATVFVEGIGFQPQIAMGYSLGNPNETRVSELVHQADLAMYTAKNMKQKAPLKYVPEIEEDAKFEAAIIAALKEALIDGEEFEVAYQPIFDATTGELKLSEALLRWHSKSMGRISPAIFIPMAERTELIVEVGDWVLRQVFADMSKNPNLRTSINLSPAQLRIPTFVQDITEMASEHNLDTGRITFELTEGMLIDDPEIAGFVLDALRECGFQIALDDFGTGFSSIGYLRKFRFDKLKIDKSFVDDLGTNEPGARLICALVHLARSLDMEIVAEGVETEEQLKLLKAADFDLIQGYLLSKPISLEDLSALHFEKNKERVDIVPEQRIA